MDNDETTLSPGLSVVVPVYNSEATLPELVARLDPVLRGVGEPFELWLVNDGSRDGSWEAICRLAREHDWVRGINMMRNYGQHNAILCGIRAAHYDVTVTMDDDLQHPPEEIPRLLKELAEGHDVVYGTPRERPHSWWRNATSKFTKRAMARAMGLANIRDLSAFRALRTELRQASASFRGSQLLLDALLAWGTSRFASIPVQHMPRAAGRSNYNLYKLIHQTILLLTGFSTGPLRLASLVGFFFTVFGMAVLAYVLGVYFIEGSLAGFPFLASIISILSGAQLFTLGIFGEYLAHIFNRSLDRPTYAVRERTAGRMAPRGEVTSPRRSVVRCRTDVSLAPLGPEHAGAMFRWMSDPQVSRNIGLRSEPSPERTSRWIANALGDPTIRPFAVMVEGRHVGNVILDRIDPVLGSARLSVYIGEASQRGSGIGISAIRQALDEAFGAMDLRKVWLTVHARNLTALNTYVQLGFVVEGVLREEFVLDGERLPAFYMGLLREEFEGARVFSLVKGDQPWSA